MSNVKVGSQIWVY